jgi:hypothetical protein
MGSEMPSAVVKLLSVSLGAVMFGPLGARFGVQAAVSKLKVSPIRVTNA